MTSAPRKPGFERYTICLPMTCRPTHRPAVPNLGFSVTRFRPSLTETVPLLGPFLIVTVTGLDAQSLVQNVALAICDSTSELTVRETSLGAAAVSACTAEIAAPTR